MIMTCDAHGKPHAGTKTWRTKNRLKTLFIKLQHFKRWMLKLVRNSPKRQNWNNRKWALLYRFSIANNVMITECLWNTIRMVAFGRKILPLITKTRCNWHILYVIDAYTVSWSTFERNAHSQWSDWKLFIFCVRAVQFGSACNTVSLTQKSCIFCHLLILTLKHMLISSMRHFQRLIEIQVRVFSICGLLKMQWFYLNGASTKYPKMMRDSEGNRMARLLKQIPKIILNLRRTLWSCFQAISSNVQVYQ